MNKTEFVNKLIEICTKRKTLYVLGGFGQYLTPDMKEYFITHYGFNRSTDCYGHNRKELIMNASEDTKAEDCVCFIKSVINGDKGYTTSPCPDISIAALLRQCSNVREISNAVYPEVGDFLTYIDYSHCGVYVGGGKVAEATYRWSDGAQLVDYLGRGWKYAGTLPYIKEDEPTPAPTTKVYAVQVMANKSKAAAKKYLKDGQSVFYIDKWYKTAYTYKTAKAAKAALSKVRKTYPDAFYTEYEGSSLIDI